MKCILVLMLFIAVCSAEAGNTPPRLHASPPPTQEELATPPRGEIQRIFLRDVTACRDSMAAALAAVPPGVEGQDSPWFGKFNSWKAVLDQLAVSRLQSDALDLIPFMVEVRQGGHKDNPLPQAFSQAGGVMKGSGGVVIHAIARCITDHKGVVDTAHRERFLTFFSAGGLDAEPGPGSGVLSSVDPAGIMILAPAETVAWLKMRPWEKAAAFQRELTVAQAFHRYAPGRDSIPVLQKRYAAKAASIAAKWNELAEWVKLQKEYAGYQEDDASLAPTKEEMATPPKGKIQKCLLRDIHFSRNLVAEKLVAAPPGPEGRDSPWFPKLRAWLEAADQLAASRLQSEAFEMIPRMKPMLLAFDRQKLPGEIREAVRDTVEFCPVIGDAIVRYIIDHKGIVDAPHREKFITFFSVPWFTTETDHEEGTLRPIDSAGIMILAPEEVVASLKRQPWSRAARFVGNRTAKDAFERYARGGDSIPLLQKRYAANAAVIRAKWTELAKWVEVQQMKAGYSGE